MDFAQAVRRLALMARIRLLGRLPRRVSERRLGIDIGRDSLQLVELCREGQDWQISAWAQEPLPPEADEHTLVAALRRLRQRSGCQHREAVVALPDSAVLTRALTLPAGLSEAELESLLQLEVAQQGVWADQAIAFDFVHQQAPPPAGQIALQLVACRHDSVEHCRRVLQRAGLKAQVVEIDSQALARACARHGPGQSGHGQVLLELRGDENWLGILQDGRMIHRRSLSPGASGARTRAGSAAEGPLLPIDDALRLLLDEVAAALQLFLASGPECPLERLLLSGQAAALPMAELARQATQRLGLPCEVLAPLAGLPLAPSLPAPPPALQAVLLPACGLALRGPARGQEIDLLPWRRCDRQRRRLQALLLVMLVLAGCALLPWQASRVLQGLQADQQQRLQQVQAQHARQLAARTERQHLERDSQALQAHLQRLQHAEARHDRLLAVLGEASRHRPDGVHFERLTLQDDRLEIQALTRSASQAAQWLRQLQDSRWLAAARWQESRRKAEAAPLMQQLRMEIHLPAAWPAHVAVQP